MEGAVIGTYRVVRKLGEGGMGAVYSGEHSLLGRKAAIKVLLPALSQNQEIVQRFFNEARAATSIQDPGIVQIFDFGYHVDGSAYIVMEYLEGEPLDARLKRLGRLQVVDALRIMRQVSSSLGAAHARGIVHRDLKPENIYLVSDREVAGGERPKILDFGIAKLTSDATSKVKTHTAAIMGTPMYMSPEQCRGAGQVDHRSDVYALGCVLYHLLVGRTPFDGEGIGEIIAMHLREPAPAPSAAVPGIPPEVDHIVLRCMAKSPDERFQTASELADALGWLLGQGGQPAGASMPSGPYAAQAGYLTPTTLSGAAGMRQSGIGGVPAAPTSATTAPAGKGRTLGLAIAGVGLVGVAVAVIFAVGSSGGKKATAAEPAALPAKAPDPVPAAPTPDTTRPPAPDIPPPVDTAAAAATIDAGVEVTAPVDAAAEADVAATDKDTSKRDREHRSRDKTRGGKGGTTAAGSGSGATVGGGKTDATGTGSAKPTNSVPGDKDGDGIPDER